jgi:hypothetical protein
MAPIKNDKPLSGIYEGQAYPDAPERGSTLEIIGFDHDKNGQAVLWVISGDRIRAVLAHDVRLSR